MRLISDRLQQSLFAFHHIGILVSDITSAASDFERCFGYVAESDIIEDKTQTAFVQFLRQPGAFFWIELVSPNGPNSKLSNALRKGGGLHHLCYEVPSIEAASMALRAQGMFPLSKPVPATAFDGKRIAWFMDKAGLLVELLESGDGPLSLVKLHSCEEGCD